MCQRSTSTGDSQSGNPCPRFTDLHALASGVNSCQTVGASKPRSLLAVETLLDKPDRMLLFVLVIASSNRRLANAYTNQRILALQ